MYNLEFSPQVALSRSKGSPANEEIGEEGWYEIGIPRIVRKIRFPLGAGCEISGYGTIDLRVCV